MNQNQAQLVRWVNERDDYRAAKEEYKAQIVSDHERVTLVAIGVGNREAVGDLGWYAEQVADRCYKWLREHGVTNQPKTHSAGQDRIATVQATLAAALELTGRGEAQ